MDTELLKSLITNQIFVISSFDETENCINNFGCVDGKIIGTGRADYTQGSTYYDLHIDDKCFELIDIPGIEGDESKYENIISESLDKAHAIVYVNGSGKKIEKETLNKIKKYMHDGTSVYAVFNVHCKAKKERIPGIDRTYTEELTDAYKQQQKIVKQTEKELTSFLGDNYKGSISLNGLLSFSSLALSKEGRTTILNESDKTLRNDQRKYLREYDCRKDDMLTDSHIQQLQTIIEQKIHTFEADIYNENIRKLRNRINEMVDKINELNDVEGKKIEGFIRTYNEFIDNCEEAKDSFIRTIDHLAYDVADSAFDKARNDLYDMIEDNGGKLSDSDVERYFDLNKDTIVTKIEGDVNNRLKQVHKDYTEAIEENKKRLVKDLEREQLNFRVSLSSVNLSLEDALGNALKYNMKDFGGHLFTTGSLALSGAGIGSLFAPGLGTIIGAAVGAVLGVLASVWNFFATKQKKIERAKAKMREAIDKQVDKVSEELDKNLQELHCKENIETNCQELILLAKTEIDSLMEVQKLLNTVVLQLRRNEIKLK